MEPFDVACPQCAKTLRVELEELVGRKVKCPVCATRFRVERPGNRSEVGIGMEELAGVGSGAARGSGSHGASNFLASLGAGPSSTPAEADDSIDAPRPQFATPVPKKGPAKAAATPAPKAAESAPGGSSASAKGKKKDMMPYVVGVAVPLAIGLIGSIVILDQKGYFNFFGRSGKGVQRQDASAFADFSRSAAKEVWKGAPPTHEFDRVAARINEAGTTYPEIKDDVAALRKRLTTARTQNGSGALSNTDAVQVLAAIDADLRKLLRKVEPEATAAATSATPAATSATPAASERSEVDDDPIEFRNSPRSSSAAD